MNFVISIDGPAASGKSSVARVLAQRLGGILVNSGAMYRAVTWAALADGITISNADAMADWISRLEITCGQSEGMSTILVNGQDPEPHIRDESVNASVSQVAALPQVRTLLVEKLRSYQDLGNIVMEGRDIGSVVFPDTPYKFYVDASEEVRNQRRQAQGEVDSIAARDLLDSTRKTAPLVVPEGALVVDSSELSLEQVVEKIFSQLPESMQIATQS